MFQTRLSRMPRLAALIAALALVPLTAAAQSQSEETRRPSHCIAIAQSAPGIRFAGSLAPTQAAFRDPLPDHTVRISYLAHAMFLIQSPGGISAATDFTGFVGNVDFLPDIVTMNHAHGTHWTANPDPAIPHVLPGWGAFGQGIDHYEEIGDMLVRNVSTDIRSAFGGIEEEGNSIFIFEVAGLCVGHLGHLHHEPSDDQYAAIGRLDVVMAAVDGGLTLELPVMIRLLKRLKSSVVIPMHWFGRNTLEYFLTGMSDEFEIRRTGSDVIELSLRDLPDRPTVMVLEPRLLSEPR